jgi:hypothetical protein
VQQRSNKLIFNHILINPKFFRKFPKPLAHQLLGWLLRGRLNVKRDLLITDKSQIRNEILAYLAENPKAQDTLEGIVEWWLLEREIKFQEAQVKKALAELVSKGLVIEQRLNNSKIHYRVNQSRYQEIKKLIKLMSG